MKKQGKILLFSILLILLLVFISNNSYAVLQVNGGSAKTDSVNNWIYNFRTMEGIGGTLGLEEAINSNLTGTTSNNLDCHMIKNTEYGALVILSASSYGNPYKIENGGTTTGNKTGAYMRINGEKTSAYYVTNNGLSYLINAAERYKNYYHGMYNPYRAGDAITQTAGWHNSNSRLQGVPTSGIGYYSGMSRAMSNSVFDFSIDTSEEIMASRPVIVVGEGF